MKKIALFLIMLSACLNGHASDSIYETGHDLLRGARLYVQEKSGKELKPMESIQAVTFHTYLEGYMGGIRVSQVITQTEFLNLPNNPSHEQYARVVLSYLEKNPTTLHESARVLMALALSKAFPKK
jgi:hypothetical protein